MTPRQRRYMGALCVSTALAMGAALTAGWVALAFGVGSVAVLAAAGWRRLRQCWREGVDAGMVFRHRGGAVYVWAHDRCQDLVCLVAGGKSRCGDVFYKDMARACMDSFAYLGHARDLIKIADDAHEPTGAELVGNMCQVSLSPINKPNDGIRCLVTSFDPIIGYRTKEGEHMPWKYARLAR